MNLRVATYPSSRQQSEQGQDAALSGPDGTAPSLGGAVDGSEPRPPEDGVAQPTSWWMTLDNTRPQSASQWRTSLISALDPAAGAVTAQRRAFLMTSLLDGASLQPGRTAPAIRDSLVDDLKQLAASIAQGR